MTKTKIREIFTSIQGEGPYVGTKQLFVRFCGCNLNCAYCDTDFDIEKSKEYTSQELVNEINSLGKDFTISLTGGEPLVSVDFLEEFLPEIKKYSHKIYLETNATLPDKLNRIIDYVDVISADIKLKSSTGMDISPEIYDSFFKYSYGKNCFAKVVFDKNITSGEIKFCTDLAKKYNFVIILQPKMIGDRFSITPDFAEKIFNKFYSLYKNTRLIPQVHKFINMR